MACKCKSIVQKTTTMGPAELSIQPCGYRNYPNDGRYIEALAVGLLTQASVINLTTMISSISAPIPPWSSKSQSNERCIVNVTFGKHLEGEKVWGKAKTKRMEVFKQTNFMFI